MHFTGQVYRHPLEANTPLLEVTAGCSHNKCAFCTMYRETPFRVSPLESIEADLQELKATNFPIERIFLVNGEPFILATDKLIKIGELIASYFPNIKTITCYASIISLKYKSLEELKRLRELKFNDLHIGLESAYDPALKLMNKGFTTAEAYENIEKIVKANFDWDAIVMLGVAGKGNGVTHIEETAKLLNQFPPYLLSIMTTAVLPDAPLAQIRDAGDFIECTEREKIKEEIYLLKLVNFTNGYFFGAHSYNLIPVNGPLAEKEEIIAYLEHQLLKMDPKILDSVYQRANI